MEDGRLYSGAGSAATDLTAALAWLWRLGPPLDQPDRRAVGIGGADEADELVGLVHAGRLAAAIVFAPEPGPATASLPQRRHRVGVAAWKDGTSLTGTFTMLEGWPALVRSSLGTHAAIDDTGRTLVLGADPASAWTELRGCWTLEALARFLPDVLERPLVLLPPVGCVRLDDYPGTAHLQLRGDANPDDRQRRRLQALARAYGGAGQVLNLAVSARAYNPERDAELGLEAVWPRSVETIAAGIRAGAFEAIAHGYLHLDPVALDQGEIEPREFQQLDEAEAARRLDAVLAWQEDVLGRRPTSFVAPAWNYSEGTRAAAAARSLPTWQRASLRPLLQDNVAMETVLSGLHGMHGLGYAAFVRLAGAGLPPTPILHGGLFDLRLRQLRASRDVVNLARLAVRRDAIRLARLRGVRWIGAGALLDLLRAHEAVQVEGTEVRLGDAVDAYLIEPGGGPPRPAYA